MRLLSEIRNLIGVIKNVSFPIFSGKLVQFVDKYLPAWDARLPQPHRDELKVCLGELSLDIPFLCLS